MTKFRNQMSTFNINEYIKDKYVNHMLNEFYLTLCITILRGAKMTNILIVEDEKT